MVREATPASLQSSGDRQTFTLVHADEIQAPRCGQLARTRRAGGDPSRGYDMYALGQRDGGDSSRQEVKLAEEAEDIKQ